MAATTDNSSASRAFHYVFAVLIGLPLIYFLCVGPAVILVHKKPKWREPIHAIYAPVIWLHDHKFMTRPMDKYLGFWVKTAHQI